MAKKLKNDNSAVARTLMDRSIQKKKLGDRLVNDAQSKIKRGAMIDELGPSFLGKRYVSERKDRAKMDNYDLKKAIEGRSKLYNSAKKDSIKSVEISKSANKAIGRDVPLPSSDKLF